MFCKYCGNQIEDGALFCQKCGKRVDEGTVAQSAMQNDSSATAPTETAAANGTQKNFIVEAEIAVPYARSEIRDVSIRAENYDKAVDLYKEALSSEGIAVASVSRKTGAMPGIVFFALALMMSAFRYFETDGFKYVYLFPDMLSVLISIAVYSGFVIRTKGLGNTFKNVRDTIISMLFILVLAIFIKILVGRFEFRQGGASLWERIIQPIEDFFGRSQYYLIIAAVALSWVGIKQIAGFIWIAVIALAVARLNKAGDYMGNVKGAAFMLSSFLGFVFYLKYEGKIITNSFKGLVSSSARYVKSNIDESGSVLRSGIGKASSRIGGKEGGGEKSIEQ